MNKGKERSVDTFGAQLLKLRKSRRYTQAAIASTAGISTGYYSAIEADKRLPPPETTLARILSALECSATEASALQEMALNERGLSLLDANLPEEVQALIIDLRTRGHALPPRFVCALRTHIREALD